VELVWWDLAAFRTLHQLEALPPEENCSTKERSRRILHWYPLKTTGHGSVIEKSGSRYEVRRLSWATHFVKNLHGAS